MKNTVIVLLGLLTAGYNQLNAQFENGEQVLRAMHKKYRQGPCRSYSFSQKNTHYKADTVSGRSEWHENVEFPDKFRIVFGKPENGNKVVFRNDSSYSYRKGALVAAKPDSNSLLLLLGGMYYRELNDVLQRLRTAGYDLTPVHEAKWNNSAVIVMGAKAGDTLANQIWIDKKDLKVMRILEKMDDGRMMDMRFESHQAWCNGFVETKVTFRRDGKLEQVEEYYDMKKTSSFPE